MNFCTTYCDTVMEQLEPLSKDMKIVLAHESSIKITPIFETFVAVGIKKCSISARTNEKIDDDVTVDTGMRDIIVTVGINIYVPYKKGTKGCVKAFDAIFDRLLYENEYELRETRLLGTTYSRETQSLVTKTEFVFATDISGKIDIPPVTADPMG
ncbi:MAG: hypothetical protein J1F37_05220 [Oscillospiraceae bacterium]|nr:hypothetical protein [Oscillospiraceae bacterium]